jgi:hypothetical protein
MDVNSPDTANLNNSLLGSVINLGDTMVTYENCAYITSCLLTFASIQEYDKLITTISDDKIKFQIDKPYILQSVWRYWYGTNRTQTIMHIFDFIDKYLESAINNIITCINCIKKEFLNKIHDIKAKKDVLSGKLCKKMCKEEAIYVKAKMTPYINALSELSINIKSAVNGIRKLSTTYTGDISISGKISEIIVVMDNMTKNCDEFINKNSCSSDS